MLLAIALGEAVYWMHRCRRIIIFSPLAGVIVGVSLLAARHWHLAQHIFTQA